MDIEKTGALIRRLRVEKGMTQMDLANALSLSDKTISKWERGAGLPDVSLLAALSEVLGADVQSLLSGSLKEKNYVGGNMRRIQFYACPICGNVMTATGSAEMSCCGRRVEALAVQPVDEAHRVRLEPMDGETYVSFAHGMEKEHFIRFVACVTFDRVLLVKLYPEQGSELRVPVLPRATYYICCSQDGLFVQKT